ncbi:DHH family phosphoesterase [Agathobaculum sp.]|uniref:DHH family phosphoesterase n=1 Tax=Agathobaculum sp. TaxID=2048138 RepID=UPI002A806BB6|nr:DHH family phosphoesterase [Agathobaculum sp.]MDY3618829.1 DHH family phosphoesterase [Agathobaculum sp.]
MNKRIQKALQPGQTLYFALFLLFALSSLFFSIPFGLIGIAVCALLRLASVRQEAERKRQVQELMNNVEIDSGGELKTTIVQSPLPTVVALATTGEIVWSNDAFSELTGQFNGARNMRISELAPNFETRWLIEGKHQLPGELRMGKDSFQIFGSMMPGGNGQMMMLHFLNCTEFVHLRDEAETRRPAIAVIAIDNYEELMKNATDSEKSAILAGIDKRLSAWTKACSAVLRKYDRDKYIFILETADLNKLAEKKFSVLQEVREIQNHEGVVATLSIGVGRDGETLAESYQYAGLAIDMALSRGGDQAVVKNRYTFDFYGGLSEEVEKRTKVKSRVVAGALSQLIRDSSQVLVMGHQNSDMDAVGAAAGMVCAARVKGKPVHIVVDRQHTMAGDLIRRLETLPEYQDVFIDADQAMIMCDFNTLLIVVDVNRPGYVESAALLQSINKVAVIDHHRRAADYIENAVVSLHEPYASSASELVSELLQYLVPTTGILTGEAEAMLAGIYLDTKGFATRTGVRTFEAAAYLRRAGAEVADVKRMFQSSFDQYMERQKLISLARDCGQGVILAVSDEEIDRIAAAQAADELLSIIGTRASVVAFRSGSDMAVSARAAGQVNVQLLMERLGGGGNHSAAGAQLKNTTAAEADRLLTETIEAYLADNSGDTKE